MKTFKAIQVVLLSLVLAGASVHLSAQDQPPPPPPEDQAPPPPPPGQDQGGPVSEQPPDNAPPQTAAPQTPQQLEQLVAPIALYPDSLVAQILNASTYPTQIVEAERWLQQNRGITGQQLGQAVDSQPWDPSVKALVQFPSVLENMDKNLSWTSSLGDAYYNQPQDVMNAVQTMRQRAQQSGTLKTTPQEVVSGAPGSIAIQPADPNVVYVPIYDPWYAYGAPIGVWPGFVYTSWWVPRPFFGFSVGFPIGFWGGFGWGWPFWGFNWHAHAVFFHGAVFVSHSPAFFDRRGFYGRGGAGFRGSAAFHGGAQFHGAAGNGFRGGAVTRSAPNVNRGFGAAQGQRGVRSGAFTGLQHGGTTRTFSARGRSSAGGGASHGGGGGHGGGHGGGGRR